MPAISDHELTQDDFLRLSKGVYDHCGINLHEGKKELAQARLAKLLRKSHFDSAGEYIDHVFQHPDSSEFAALIDALSTNLTSFFREGNHFEYLGKTLLPDLFRRKLAADQRKIRGWSAACSSGEEPYSIAMTVLDALQAHADLNVKILATDISHHMLAIARAGIYNRDKIASIPTLLKGSGVVSKTIAGEPAFEVTAAVRNLVQFAHLNLMEPWPFNGPMDFIFCRNVMIYFDKPTQQQLVGRFFNILDSGGILMTGHSESLTGIQHDFRYVQPTIYAKP